MARLDAVDISGNQDNPVAVMADQVGANIVTGDNICLFLRCTRRDQQTFGNLDQFFR